MHSESCDPREPQSPTGRRILDFEFRNSLPRLRTPSLSSAAPDPSPRSPALSSLPVMGSEARSAVKIVKGEFGYVLEDVPHLTDYLPDLPAYPNPLQDNPAYSVVKQYFVDQDDTVPEKIVVQRDSPRGLHFRRAGPRQRGGYRGFYARNTIQLTPKSVNDIHKRGGTVLGTSRGGHDTLKIVDNIQDRGINQEIRRRRLKVSVAGIPKTIDNDIAVIDKSFGFDTAVEEAQRAINAAHVEAGSVENGIGVVKLMGRYSGFIAMYATLASRDVDCCLIPESPFYLEGKGGLFEYMEKQLKENGHMVIVVAEGAGQDLIAESMRSMNHEDASGNKLLLDVGLWLSQRIKRVTETRNTVVITDRMWARLLSSTNQPSFLSSKDIEEANMMVEEEQPKQTVDEEKSMENGST
ncbi:Phosphofructokinase [Musa troglodytarum]|uniref:Phosphofructokinase n=1 Tax=Musa troglodytarum TaxID=320322 RepID=A0A9E7F906_9LILI|nr:Phosphofructokinase [Musa troglodytarum]